MQAVHSAAPRSSRASFGFAAATTPGNGMSAWLPLPDRHQTSNALPPYRVSIVFRHSDQVAGPCWYSLNLEAVANDQGRSALRVSHARPGN